MYFYYANIFNDAIDKLPHKRTTEPYTHTHTRHILKEIEFLS